MLEKSCLDHIKIDLLVYGIFRGKNGEVGQFFLMRLWTPCLPCRNVNIINLGAEMFLMKNGGNQGMPRNAGIKLGVMKRKILNMR